MRVSHFVYLTPLLDYQLLFQTTEMVAFTALERSAKPGLCLLVVVFRSNAFWFFVGFVFSSLGYSYSFNK